VSAVAILGLHRVGPLPAGSWETWFWISEATFERFLDELSAEGWEPVSLELFLAGLDYPAMLPPRTALITFDDGYHATAEAALRVLAERALAGVFFVPSDFVGGMNDFEAGTDEPREKICSVADLAALEAAGISVQSHGASHTAFTALRAEEQERELRESKAALERVPRVDVRAVAYPYGELGDAGVAQRAGYVAAFGYGGTSFAVIDADRWALPRLALGPDSDLRAMLEAA
jgi:peptidoglycan/xylan/chitin deacetylase (PgdA/CDA1 family)